MSCKFSSAAQRTFVHKPNTQNRKGAAAFSWTYLGQHSYTKEEFYPFLLKIVYWKIKDHNWAEFCQLEGVWDSFPLQASHQHLKYLQVWLGENKGKISERKLIVEGVLFQRKSCFYRKQDAFSPEKAFLKMFSLEMLGKTNLNISQKRRFLLFYFRRILSLFIVHTVGITPTLLHCTALGLVYNIIA